MATTACLSLVLRSPGNRLGRLRDAKGLVCLHLLPCTAMQLRLQHTHLGVWGPRFIAQCHMLVVSRFFMWLIDDSSPICDKNFLPSVQQARMDMQVRLALPSAARARLLQYKKPRTRSTATFPFLLRAILALRAVRVRPEPDNRYPCG
ncbi:hypothetical protein GY45DRAFT_819096 [Cubamyces sp. BRFM 1775]|nr:hypothetical protein GY45DRAFT_819096 [Cubamyces sp. BRFM 1775]